MLNLEIGAAGNPDASPIEIAAAEAAARAGDGRDIGHEKLPRVNRRERIYLDRTCGPISSILLMPVSAMVVSNSFFRQLIAESTPSSP